MRTLNDHVVNPANDKLVIEVVDEPGAGGAQHHYRVSGFNTATNPSDPFMPRHGEPAEYATVLFQNGPINEVGVNGVTQEVLLAIVSDRLRSFQAGPFACRENALALTKIEEAQHLASAAHAGSDAARRRRHPPKVGLALWERG